MARPRCEGMSSHGYQCERRKHKPTTRHVAHTYTGFEFRWDDETPEADAPENERGTST